MTVDLEAWAARHQVILLEGCDGVGKTTLAVALAERHGYRLVHATRTPESVDLAERYRSILSWPGPLVLDRSFVSELVYGPLLHGRSRLTLDQVVDLTAAVAARTGLIVHLSAPPEVIATRLERRDGSVPDLSHITAILDGYAQVFAQLARHAPAITIQTAQAT